MEIVNENVPGDGGAPLGARADRIGRRLLARRLHHQACRLQEHDVIARSQYLS